MKKENKKEPKKLLRLLPFIVGGFGKGIKFHKLESFPATMARGDISGKAGCRRSTYTRWKKARSMGITKRRRV